MGFSIYPYSKSYLSIYIYIIYIYLYLYLYLSLYILACPESLSVLIFGQCGGAPDPVTAAAGLRAGERKTEKPASACRGESCAESLESE